MREPRSEVEARDRLLGKWFERVTSGQLRLPRFQRFESWGHGEVSSILEAVLRGLPAGAALVLEVGDHEKFNSRVIVGAPAPTDRVTEHLLDGQQRMTALYRAFHDDYPNRTYFLAFEKDDEGREQPVVVGQARWTRDGKSARYPLWADSPTEVHKRGLIPISLLRPGDIRHEIISWCDAATNDVGESRELEGIVSQLREGVATYNFPFLALPPTTPRDIALDVFINLNTKNVNLSPFDIVVAQLEEARGASLHELVEELNAAVPGLRRYREISEFILDVAALREDRPPTRSSYFKLDLNEVDASWSEIIDGLRFTVDFLETERVFDGERLPTVSVLPVLAAMHSDLPESLDAAGNARALLRAYVWRAFTTSRYEQSSATRSLQDLRGLRKEIASGGRTAPIFDEEAHPLPSVDEIVRAGWPKKKEILARGILAASLRAGAEDIADGSPATAVSLDRREYHHLFPDALLTGPGGLDADRSYRAVNCALITWKTNRKISAKEPLAYLRERVELATLGEAEIRRRLQTHLVPFDELAKAGGYAELGESTAQRIADDYDEFSRERAALIQSYLEGLCRGEQPPGQ